MQNPYRKERPVIFLYSPVHLHFNKVNDADQVLNTKPVSAKVPFFIYFLLYI